MPPLWQNFICLVAGMPIGLDGETELVATCSTFTCVFPNERFLYSFEKDKIQSFTLFQKLILIPFHYWRKYECYHF